MKTLILLLFPLFGWGQSEIRDNDLMGPLELRDAVYLMTVRPCDFSIKGKCYSKRDTIPVTIEVQYQRRDIPGLRDCYLINGEPWYRSTAPLTRGKWVKIRAYRWRISEGWNVTKNK